ncbi:unnamed protein product [Phytophthora lilii]|uniref:Unnamed protein product n=1 Tax=Phytophthora lilii TaxID=2077276 RepID=A0A9W7DCT6_9STRA|nr:unnamed protein product [Phytophthora lilii]
MPHSKLQTHQAPQRQMCRHFENLDFNNCDECIDEFYGYTEIHMHLADAETIAQPFNRNGPDFEFEEEDDPFDLLNLSLGDFVKFNGAEYQRKLAFFEQRRYFKAAVAEELIAEAMSPRRLMKRMEPCDAFEQFLEAY